MIWIWSALGLAAVGGALVLARVSGRRRRRQVATPPVPSVPSRETVVLDEVQFRLPFHERDEPYRVELPDGVTPVPPTDEPAFHGPFERLEARLARGRMSPAAATDIALQLCADIEARIEAGKPIPSGPDAHQITVVTEGDAVRCQWSPPKEVRSKSASDEPSDFNAAWLLAASARSVKYARHDDPRADHGAVIARIAGVWLACASGQASSEQSSRSEPIYAPSVERVIFGALLHRTQRFRPRTVRDLARALWLTARDHRLALTTRAFEGTPIESAAEPSPPSFGRSQLAPLFPGELVGLSFDRQQSDATARFWPGDFVGYEASGHVPPRGINAGVASWKVHYRYGVPIGREVGGIY